MKKIYISEAVKDIICDNCGVDIEKDGLFYHFYSKNLCLVCRKIEKILKAKKSAYCLARKGIDRWGTKIGIAIALKACELRDSTFEEVIDFEHFLIDKEYEPDFYYLPHEYVNAR